MASRDTTIMTGDVGKQHRDLFLGSILAVMLFEKVSSKLPAHLSSYGRKDNCDKRSRDIARRNVKRISVLTRTQTVFTQNCLLCFQKRVDVFVITMKQTMEDLSFIVERLNSSKAEF